MRNFFFSLVCLVTFGFTAQAQVDAAQRDSILQPIRTMFAGMLQADTTLFSTCFAPGARLETAGGVSPKQPVKAELLTDFVRTIASLKPGMADERIEIGAVQSDGRIAHVWTRYEFWLNNQFSHCGTNAFTLVNTSTGWKIQYVLDTRYREGCKSTQP